jgi:hypothetical protein
MLPDQSIVESSSVAGEKHGSYCEQQGKPLGDFV